MEEKPDKNHGDELEDLNLDESFFEDELEDFSLIEDDTEEKPVEPKASDVSDEDLGKLDLNAGVVETKGETEEEEPEPEEALEVKQAPEEFVEAMEEEQVIKQAKETAAPELLGDGDEGNEQIIRKLDSLTDSVSDLVAILKEERIHPPTKPAASRSEPAGVSPAASVLAEPAGLRTAVASTKSQEPKTEKDEEGLEALLEPDTTQGSGVLPELPIESEQRPTPEPEAFVEPLPEPEPIVDVPEVEPVVEAPIEPKVEPEPETNTSPETMEEFALPEPPTDFDVEPSAPLPKDDYLQVERPGYASGELQDEEQEIHKEELTQEQAPSVAAAGLRSTELPEPPAEPGPITPSASFEEEGVDEPIEVGGMKSQPLETAAPKLDYKAVDVMGWGGGELSEEEAEEVAQAVAVDDIRSKARESSGLNSKSDTRRTTRGKGGKAKFLNIGTKFDRPLIVSFTSPKGGVGKSTTALNFGAFLAKSAELSGSPMRVLVFDGDTANGNLALRAGGPIKPNMLDMLIYMEKHDGINSYEEMQQFVFGHSRIKNLDILPAPESIDIIDQLTDDDLSNTMVTLARFYQIIVIDTGTQIIERTNQAWLAFSQQVYLMVEPDIACLQSTLTYAKRVRKLGIVTPDRFRVVMIKSDIQAEIDPKKSLKKFFKWIPEHKLFFMKDYQRDAFVMGNIGDFLVLESPEYAEEVLEIARSSLTHYEKNIS